MRKGFVAVVLLVQLLLASGCEHSSSRARTTPTIVPTQAERVSAYVCDLTYEPTDLLIACGDGNARVAGLHWTTWGAESANGTGTWQQNDCVPDCAGGRFHDYPVRLTLGQPIAAQGTRIFGTVEAQFPGRSPNGVLREIIMKDGHYAG